ncbi:MAG: hypothetical protein QOF33_4033 [Thermomicrobiales bacterium]|jgi:uncharacterized protein YciW|nr:hypothetical protein [Thermomicrobiales bacterium]MEA2585948.1 hypothetical protein [Thermomicrobiales bacterium]
MSATQVRTTDVINSILGAADGGTIVALRNQKPALVDELQAYYLALFEPDAASAVALPLVDRYLIAVRVASHSGSTAVANWYANLALEAGIGEDTLARLRDVATPWSDQTPLGAAMRHADLLTTRPSAAEAAHLQTLKEAGYSPAGVMSLSQVIAFVSYQLRLIAGLRALGEAS